MSDIDLSAVSREALEALAHRIVIDQTDAWLCLPEINRIRAEAAGAPPERDVNGYPGIRELEAEALKDETVSPYESPTAEQRDYLRVHGSVLVSNLVVAYDDLSARLTESERARAEQKAETIREVIAHDETQAELEQARLECARRRRELSDEQNAHDETQAELEQQKAMAKGVIQGLHSDLATARDLLETAAVQLRYWNSPTADTISAWISVQDSLSTSIREFLATPTPAPPEPVAVTEGERNV